MINVTCALIRNEEDEVLTVQRGENSDHAFLWEFPGGKINVGESEDECVIREISEELSMDIIICGTLLPVEYDYGHKQVKLIPFICDTLDELPLLTEHIAFKWLSAEKLMTVDYCEADELIAKQYLEFVKKIYDPHEKAPAVSQSSFDDQDLQSMINRMMGAKEVEWIAASAIGNQVIFRKLLEYSFSTEKKLAFHASWTLTKVCDKLPETIYPYLSDIIDGLQKIDNESVQRSFLRILSLTDFDKIDKQKHGILTDYCFRMLNSGFSAIAVKAYSMEILYRLAVKYPELANELSASIYLLQGEGSAGIKARGHIIMKKLAGITSDPGSSQQ